MIGFNLSTGERNRRWNAIRDALRTSGIDVLVLPNGGDPQGVSDIRYLTGYAQAGTALLVFRDQDPEAVCATGLEYLWVKRSSWVQPFYQAGTVLEDLLNRLAIRGRNLVIGVTHEKALPKAWIDEITAAYGAPTVIGNAIRALRLVKSEEELALIKRSAALADASIRQGLSRVRLGMPQMMLRAEIEFAALASGAEGTHGAFTVYPGEPVTDRAAPYLGEQPLTRGDFAMVEVTPSARGYWSQLATHVAFGSPSVEYRRMYDVSLAARRAGLDLLRPGWNLRDVVARMREHVLGEGLTYVGAAAGHGLGLTAAEPRVMEGVDHEIRSGQAFVIHAVLANDRKEEVLRGDTYLVTDDGPERLNGFGEELVICN